MSTSSFCMKLLGEMMTGFVADASTIRPIANLPR